MDSGGGLPAIVSEIPNDVRNFLQRVREILDTQQVARGSVSSGGYFGPRYISDAPALDYTPPPVITGLATYGAITTIMLTWNDPAYANLSYAEIWRSSVNDIGLAVLAGTTTGHMYSDSVDANSSYYYWVRLVSRANVAGDYNAISGVHGVTSIDPTDIISILTAHGLFTDTPFYYQAVETTVDGVVVPPGTYFRQGYFAASTITRAMIANEAVDSSKIHDLTVDKLTSGTMTGQTITLGLNGHIKSGQTAWNTGNGWWIGKGTDGYCRVSFGSPTGSGLDWSEETGMMRYRGVAQFTSGSSGYDNITDKPGSLGAINVTEGEKLTGIADYATDGASLVREGYFDDQTTVGSWTGGTLQAIIGQPFGMALRVTVRDTYELPSSPCVEGDGLYVSAMINTMGCNFRVGVGVAWGDVNGNVLSWTLGCSLEAGKPWTECRGRFSAPAGAVQCLPWIQINGTSGLGYADVAQIQILRHDSGATVGAPSGTYVGMTLAEQVEANASNAIATATAMASDGVLSAQEKAAWRVQWPGMLAQHDKVQTQAGVWGLQAEAVFTDLLAAKNNLETYLTSSLSVWSAPSTDAVISPTTLLTTNVASYYNALTAANNRLITASNEKLTQGNLLAGAGWGALPESGAQRAQTGLQAGVTITAGGVTVQGGAGDLMLDGTNGEIIAAQAGGNGSLVGLDYARMCAGDLSFYRWDGSQHQVHKSLKRSIYGVCQDGDTVNVGFFKTAPSVILSPSSLECFKKAYVNQDQKFRLEAANVRQSGSEWLFEALCQLQLSSGSTTGGSGGAGSGGSCGVGSITVTGASVPISVPNVVKVSATINYSAYEEWVDGEYGPQHDVINLAVWLEVYTTAGGWAQSSILNMGLLDGGASGTAAFTISGLVNPTQMRAKLTKYYASGPHYGGGRRGQICNVSIASSVYTLASATISLAGTANYLAVGD